MTNKNKYQLLSLLKAYHKSLNKQTINKANAGTPTNNIDSAILFMAHIVDEKANLIHCQILNHENNH